MRRLMDVALVAVLSVPCHAGTTDDSVPDARFVEYAKGFSKYTAKLTGTTKDKAPFVATAVIISADWAVTAAHVADRAVEMELDADGVKRTASRIVQHPDWKDDTLGGPDIAMVKVSEPWGLDFYPPLSSGGERVGQLVSVCGYGVHGRMSTGYTDHDGRLRAGTNTIHAITDDTILCLAECGSSPLEYCTSPGDSGGPLFAGGKLAGIHSYTCAPKGPLKSKSGEESGHTKVSRYRDWIGAVMEGRE